ncbi:MAG: class I SAM-dependent methyltransferase, partial [Chloroflexi bacterium]|nr:class I SAM-dependent methyltransferase [Chloroflexota bacterium]
LLRDGLDRAAEDAALAPVVARITVVAEDARDVLARLGAGPADARPDVVIVDPMFPPRRKSAAVKKEMQALHRLLGAEPEPASLLAAALAVARRRVVVKRPGDAPPIEGPRPSIVIGGKTARFDVYVTG